MPQEDKDKPKKYPDKIILFYHNSDFSSLEEYITAMKKPAISDEESSYFRNNIHKFYELITSYKPKA